MSLEFVMSWLDLSLLSVLSLLPILLIIIKRAISKKIRLPPSPPKLPFIGNLHQLSSLPHRSLYALSEKHGPLMLLQLGQVPTLVVSSADIARDILRTHDAVFASRPSIKAARILLYGCSDVSFAPYGEHWRQMRKVCVIHLLSDKMLQSFHWMRVEEVAIMITEIRTKCSSLGSVNLSKVLNLFVNNILCRAVMGKSFRGEAENEIFCKLTEENIILLMKFCVEDYFPSLGWLDVISGFERRVKKNLKNWEVLLDEVIEEHSNRFKDKNNVSENGKLDFVDVLLNLQKDPNMELVLDRKMIRLLIMDMIAAGTDTSFIVLEWGMSELIRNSEAMKKLQDEVRGIANTDSMVRVEDLSRMDYLKATVKEILRLRPAVPLLLPRESMDSCEVKGYDIPMHTRVFINAWAIGRDPKFWEAPEEFRPERFLNSNIDYKGKDFQYIPFGAGRRICPGTQFAVSTLELALANLVHHFDWKLPEGMKVEDLDMAEAPGLTTRRAKELYLVAKPAFA